MSNRVSGIILAGGQGQRLGGIDKGWVELDGQPLVAHVIQKLKSQVESITISANRSLERYRTLGYPVVSDLRGPYLGPLAGIATALANIDDDLALVVPCDTPFLPTDLRQRLEEALQQNSADIAIAHDGEQLQHMCALLRRSLLPQLEAELKANHLKVQRWMMEQRHCTVSFNDPHAFININSDSDLANATATLSSTQ